MSGFLKDLKFAVHALIAQPVFSVMIVGMLAIGIAGNTAIFSLFNGLFLHPLPFLHPERLMDVDETAPKWDLEYVGIAYPDFHAWREDNRSFDAMAVYRTQDLNLFLKGEARRIQAAQVTHDMASVLKINPVLGRHFAAEEDRPGGPKVAMIGFGLWQEQFGGDSSILGETLLLDSEPHTIIGVLPSEAVFIGGADLWVPLATDVNERPGSWYLRGMGRLKSGVTRAQAREDLNRIHKNMIDSRPANEITSPVIAPILDRYLGDARMGMTVLLVAVGIVLLIACANIAGLMLARSSSREKEIGIRVAMGAARRRIVRLLLTESIVLSALGAAVGTVLGFWTLRIIVSLMPEQIPRWISFEIDFRFLLFTLLVSLGAAAVFGLAPALQASRLDVHETLKASSMRSSSTAEKRRSFSALVVSEIALALVLLIAAGLLVASFGELQKVDPGFRPENVLAYQMFLPRVNYQETNQRVAFIREHLERMRALPGVEAVGAASLAPLGNHDGYFFETEGAPPLGPDEKNPVVLQRSVLPGYFRALGITLLRGHVFNESDGLEEESPVVIVNQTFAKRFFPEGDPVGKRIRYPGEENPWMTVIGVTKDVLHYGLATEMRSGVYVPYGQMTTPYLTVVARTAMEPLSLVAPTRQAIREVDAEIPLYDVKTMSQKLDESLWPYRAASWFLVAFATIALVLASAGIYGVISYSVSQRAQELSICMALGASPGRVLGRVMQQGLILLGIGVTLGLAGAFMAARALSSLLFGVSPTDVGVYTAVTLLLAGIALVANLIPARRAAALDPIQNLRAE